MLNLLLVTLGLAALTELAGLSLALGAFLAGMLIAETEYRYQVEEDIKPFRDVLLGLFFVTVGMSLDLAVVAAHWGWVLLLLVVPVVAKLVLIVRSSRAFGAPLGDRAAHRLLSRAGRRVRAGDAGARAGRADRSVRRSSQLVLAAMVLSMLAAPLVIQFAEPIVRRFTANDWLARAAQVTRIAATTMARQDHVIICGYGRSGQNLARLLEREDIAFVALDSIRSACARRPATAAASSTATPGRREALFAAGLCEGARARHHVRRHRGRAQDPPPRRTSARPELPVIVRTLDDTRARPPARPRARPRSCRRCWKAA